jgi:MFS transporter, PAT family, beta-lactamase induction signal transducer AmpG
MRRTGLTLRSSSQRVPPVWLMGLSGTSFGLVGGYVAFTLAQSLAAQHVPEVAIASITALAISPSFFSFVASPLLDVWFSRRAYATGLATAAALFTGGSAVLFHHLLLLRIAAVVGYAAIQLFYSALGGWLSTVTDKGRENQLSAWITISNTAGFGIMAFLGGELIRRLRPALAASVITILILLPLVIFVWIPALEPDGKLAGESFRAFWADVFSLFRKSEVLVAIALFVTPCATFSLTNMMGGFGGDFHASPRAVGLLGGAGSLASGVCGSLLLPVSAKWMRLRPLYLTTGVVGSLFTAGLLALSHSVSTYTLAVVGENVFQSLAIACSIAICFETIGQNNPLAATNFAIFSAAYNLPITYMLVVDGWGYGRAGITGAFATDAGLGVAACIAMGLMLVAVNRWRANREVVELTA